MTQFDRVGGLKPQRSMFSLDHTKLFTGDMGKLYPILVEDCIPGDVFKIGNEVVVRFWQSLFNPVLHEVNCKVDYFFVPYRILWHDDKLAWNHEADRAPFDAPIQHDGSFEKYITGNYDGTEILNSPNILNPREANNDWHFPDGAFSYGGIFDYLYGFVRNPDYGVQDLGDAPSPAVGTEKLSILPLVAYFRIWDEFFRDEQLNSSWVFNGTSTGVDGAILSRAWEKDYFTSALPWQQRGIAPAVGIDEISGFADFTNSMLQTTYTTGGNDSVTVSSVGHFMLNPTDPSQARLGAELNTVYGLDSASGRAQAYLAALNRNQLQALDAAAFTAADVRFAFQLQKFLERSARAGVRYTEFLKAHHDVAPLDERLDRPEWIGGTTQPVIFNEVLQTSTRTSDIQSTLGSIGGHGISASRSGVGRYHVKEFGIIIGLLSVMPRLVYQHGVDRFWSRRSRWEYCFPEFAHLSEQPILKSELGLMDTNLGTNSQVFGYIGRYDEYRWRRSRVHGMVRDGSVYGDGTAGDMSRWSIAFNYSVRTPQVFPVLNENFINSGLVRKDYLPGYSLQDAMLISVFNRVTAVRPLPIIAEPGLVDHF